MNFVAETPMEQTRYYLGLSLRLFRTTSIHTVWIDQLLAVEANFIVFRAVRAGSFSASLCLDCEHSGRTDNNVIDVGSFERIVVKDLVPMLAKFIEVLGHDQFSS